MQQVVPRFEFRTFGQELSRIRDDIRKRSTDGETVRESREVYLLRPREWHRNLKIRGGKLELKELIEQRAGLQRWKPAGQWTFPLEPGELQESILPGLQPRGTPLARPVSRERLLGELVTNRHRLWRANLFKRRFGYRMGQCATEVDDILVNGALIRSVAIESEDPAAVTETRRELALDDCENISYPLALARIMGLEPLPDADRYG